MLHSCMAWCYRVKRSDGAVGIIFRVLPAARFFLEKRVHYDQGNYIALKKKKEETTLVHSLVTTFQNQTKSPNKQKLFFQNS